MSTANLALDLKNMKAAIAKKVRELRQERHWSQAELSQHLGLSQSRLSEIEKGGGSFTAEQFLLILKIFNVTVDDFAPRTGRKQNEKIQNALARLGAAHLQESIDVLPSERLQEVGDVVREVLIAAESPRHITGLAPVLVHHADRINLAKLGALFFEVGLGRRLAWLIANILEAVRQELSHLQARPWAALYRRAEVVLSDWLDFLTTLGDARRSRLESMPSDILDPDIRSKKSLEGIKASSSDISRRWGIVTSLQVADFVEALRGARASI